VEQHLLAAELEVVAVVLGRVVAGLVVSVAVVVASSHRSQS
jgi:hypothetical protein